MIFLANVLVMNGGTTFLIRLIKERSRRGQRSAVLLLSDRIDPALVDTLGQNAEILRLSDYLIDHGIGSRGLLGVFAPIAHRRLARALAPFGFHIHAMSIFGLILGLRLVQRNRRGRVTVGIYHQNEFLYRAPPFYFAKKVSNLFAQLPPENIIFFNESSRDNYTKHFADKDYAGAHLLPIGITLDKPVLSRPNGLGHKIVSIGNLVSFKTYNRHMIGVVAALRARFPNIRYDIYGTGPLATELGTLAAALGVNDCVTLRGPLEYARLREVVAGSDLFVGSGTALIEAAAVGRPAMIGIESVEYPETYGYLSDARGYSYNENMPGVDRYMMVPLVERLFSDSDHWSEVAAACAVKAQAFSVAVTADGFELAGITARPLALRISALALLRLAASSILMRISEILGRSEPFGDRRNQSY